MRETSKQLSISLITLSILLLAAPDVISARSEPRFVKISERIAVANKGMALKLKNSIWPSADGVWNPTKEEVLATLSFLESPAGQQQTLAVGSAKIDMSASLQSIRRTRFQVYGLIIKHHKHLLYDSAPDISELRVGYPDRWLEESVSQSVYDGGASIWFVLYDLDAKHTIATHRRPY
jgi:hypothetical protein